MFVPVCGVEIECDILAFLIELRSGRGRQALRKGGLTVELVRKLTRREHRLGVRACRPAKSGIERQMRSTGLRSRLIRQIQQLLFGLYIVVAERNIRGTCGSRL